MARPAFEPGAGAGPRQDISRRVKQYVTGTADESTHSDSSIGTRPIPYADPAAAAAAAAASTPAAAARR
jgi:hypothetical protein